MALLLTVWQVTACQHGSLRESDAARSWPEKARTTELTANERGAGALGLPVPAPRGFRGPEQSRGTEESKTRAAVAPGAGHTDDPGSSCRPCRMAGGLPFSFWSPPSTKQRLAALREGVLESGKSPTLPVPDSPAPRAP